MPPATVNRVRVPGVSFTLLEFAALNGQLQVVEALLSFGVDVSIRILLSSGAFIQGYGSAVVLACGPGLHQKRLEHCKAYSRSEIVAVLLSDYVAFSAAIRTCCIRSLSPISRRCFGAASGTFADIYARLLGPSFASLQPPQPHADTAAQELATEETWEMYRRQRVLECSNERCLVLIVLAPYRGASAKLSSCSSCKVAPYCSKECQAADLPYHQTKKPQKLKMNQDAAVNG